MAFKTPPPVQRAKEIDDFSSKGFYERNFAQNLEEDFKIREFLKEKFEKVPIEKIEIERSKEKVEVRIHTPRPALLIGRGGSLIEKLKEQLKNELKIKSQIVLEVKESKSFWDKASLVAFWMKEQIEKRTPYRRVLKAALGKIMEEKGVLGARVQVSGRLDGVEIARKEWLGKGKLPRATMRSVIDFAKEEAQTKVGTVGIKVWIYKGEKFE